MEKIKLLIIGQGKVGKPLAQAAVRTGSFNVSVVEKAGKLAEFNSFASITDAFARQSYDLVVVATPMSEFGNVMGDIATHMNGAHTVVTDISSAVKQQPYEIAQNVFQAVERLELMKQYISSNPLTGRPRGEEKSIYSDRPVYLCISAENTELATKKLQQFWAKLEADPILIPSVAAHDELTVLNSLWPHIFGFAIRLFAAEGKIEISEDMLNQVSKTTQIDGKDLETHLNRWSRFLQYHHQDLSKLMLEMSEELAGKHRLDDPMASTQALISSVEEITIDRIKSWKTNHPDTICEISDLAGSSSLSRLKKAAHMNIEGSYNRLEFSDFLRKMAVDFTAPQKAMGHIRSAFTLALSAAATEAKNTHIPRNG